MPDNFQNGMLTGGDSNIFGIRQFGIKTETMFAQLPKDTLSIFILNMNNTTNKNIDSIWKEMNYGQRLLQRFDVSLQDMRTLNFIISYPPDERMKYMKMYPPYEE